MVSRWVLSWNSGWQSPLRGISFFGEPWLILALAISGFVSAAVRAQDTIMWAFFWSGIAYGINTLIKQLARRHRPHNRRVSMLGIKSYSFPSGHAFGAVIFYGMYAYLDYIYLEAPLNVIIVLALTALTILIGISRVRLAIHYPSDVVGGWILGGAALSIIIWRLF